MNRRRFLQADWRELLYSTNIFMAKVAKDLARVTRPAGPP